MGIIGVLGHFSGIISGFGGVKWGIASAVLVVAACWSRRRGRIGLVGLGFLAYFLVVCISASVGIDFWTSVVGLFNSRYGGVGQVACLAGIWFVGLAAFPILTATALMVDCLGGYVQWFNGVTASSFQGHPVFFGSVMAIGGTWLFFSSRAGKIWWHWKAASLLCLGAIWMTESRGAMIGYGFGLAAGFLYRRPKAILLAMVIVLSALMGHFSRKDLSLSDQGRLLTWSLAVKDTSPLGTGPDTFYAKALLDKAFNPEWVRIYYKASQDHAHNSLLEALSSTGWIGLVVFVFLCSAIYWHVRKDQAVLGALAAGAVCSMLNPTPMDAKILMVALAASVRESWEIPNMPRIPVGLTLAVISFVLFCYTAVIERVYLGSQYGLTGNSLIWSKTRLRLLPLTKYKI